MDVKTLHERENLALEQRAILASHEDSQVGWLKAEHLEYLCWHRNAKNYRELEAIRKLLDQNADALHKAAKIRVTRFWRK